MRIIPVSNFDESVNDLIASTLNRFDIIIFKDDKYLNWRFANKDAGEFKILLAQKDGEDLGYIVFKLVENETVKYGEIVDILVRSGFDYVTVVLLLEAIESLVKGGAISVYCWLPKRHQYTSSLKRLGFFESECEKINR